MVMKYLNSHEFPSVNDSLSFHDLDHSVVSCTSICVWINNEFYGRLGKLCNEIELYKDIYPVAYQKLADKINGSKKRLQKERLLLVMELKRVRDRLLEKNDSFVLKKNLK